LTGKVTAGLVEIKGSLPHVTNVTNVTCRLTAKKPGSAPCPTLVYFFLSYRKSLLTTSITVLLAVYFNDATEHLRSSKHITDTTRDGLGPLLLGPRFCEVKIQLEKGVLV